jgi:ABC-type bacteriocin/lantibiotic exporter with double-glycine peptidase domain
MKDTNLNISHIFFRSVRENVVLFSILTAMILSFVFVDVFYIQRTFLNIIKSVGDSNLLLKYIVILCLFLLFKSFLQTILDYYLVNFTNSLSKNLLGRVVDNIHDKYNGNISNLDEHLQTTYYDKMNNSLSDIFENMKYRKMQFIIVMVASTLYSFYLNRKFGLIYFIGIILCITIIVATSLITQKYGKTNENNKNLFLTEYTNFINNLIPIYTHNTLKYEKDIISGKITNVLNGVRENLFRSSVNKFFMFTLIVVILLAVIYVQTKYFSSEISITHRENTIIICFDLLEQFGYLNLYFLPLSESISRYNTLKKNIEIDNPNVKNSGDTKIVSKYNINLHNVYYDNILKNINLDIKYGEKVAIVGSIGSGKTTLIKLICRLLPVSSGNVYLGNIDINTIDINSYRDLVAYVPQYVNLFNRTIKENIFYGSEYSENIVKKYGINTIFKDLDKNVGFNGKNMSGGQKQIIYILRNLVNSKKKIIVMDEPTASLDGNTKDYFLNLIKLITDKTIIIVTHDKDCFNVLTRRITLDSGSIK